MDQMMNLEAAINEAIGDSENTLCMTDGIMGSLLWLEKTKQRFCVHASFLKKKHCHTLHGDHVGKTVKLVVSVKALSLCVTLHGDHVGNNVKLIVF